MKRTLPDRSVRATLASASRCPSRGSARRVGGGDITAPRSLDCSGAEVTWRCRALAEPDRCNPSSPTVTAPRSAGEGLRALNLSPFGRTRRAHGNSWLEETSSSCSVCPFSDWTRERLGAKERRAAPVFSTACGRLGDARETAASHDEPASPPACARRPLWTRRDSRHRPGPDGCLEQRRQK